MSTPTTTLDTRFSYPDATATSWRDTNAVLAAAGVCWLSTVRTDGRPHVSPVVTVWLDDAIHFTTANAGQKAANLRTNPHVVLTTGCNRWDVGLDVVVEGEAERVADDATLRRLADAWRGKWDGRWDYGVRDDAPLFQYRHGNGDGLVYRVAPVKVLVFSRPVLAQTRHTF